MLPGLINTAPQIDSRDTIWFIMSILVYIAIVFNRNLKDEFEPVEGVITIFIYWVVYYTVLLPLIQEIDIPEHRIVWMLVIPDALGFASSYTK